VLSPRKLATALRPLDLTPGEVRSSACLNCSAPLTGPFCAECGQRDIPPYPSTRELVVDAFWELSGWDGRFASTVRALVERPGKLTREFLEGRRARYLSPLRLYLLASLAYFVVAAAAPKLRLASGKEVGGIQIATTTTKASRAERVGAATRDALGNEQTLTTADRDAALKDIDKAPALLRPLFKKAVADPTGFKRGIVDTMPRMLFALLPVFALIVSFFYRRKKYPEHLYFAIHLHAFVFLALTVAQLVKFTRLPVVVGTVGAIALVWIPIYATLAFRRVYGGSIARTLFKEVGIGLLYSVVEAVGFVSRIYWVSLAPCLSRRTTQSKTTRAQRGTSS
jgi:hypothetical protein